MVSKWRALGVGTGGGGHRGASPEPRGEHAAAGRLQGCKALLFRSALTHLPSPTCSPSQPSHLPSPPLLPGRQLLCSLTSLPAPGGTEMGGSLNLGV